MLWEQDAGGSNPSAPTISIKNKKGPGLSWAFLDSIDDRLLAISVLLDSSRFHASIFLSYCQSR